ncbi:Rho GTPase-activating protein 1 [Turnera subulata]|uniref:Rho GTPase-activating protein 1 n=1 Tax=Turnera subulata TaxID=218843 RepID=A0A9Q0JI46_9ROSI|nr:Rho GTPase-activating protein 1 [Turnera subulata]
MTEILHSPSHFPPSSPSPSPSSSSSSNSLTCAPSPPLSCAPHHGEVEGNECDPEEEEREERRRDEQEEAQLSLLALLVALFRKSLAACKNTDRRELCAMEIGWPTNVRHVAHVTFDRFNGFLGLPVEFEPEVPRRPPSASATVFGVSTESMQLSYDTRGNSVPTILLLMQSRLYAQGGLQAEGIFRINGENSQEEYVRDQLNSGVVPEGVDVHCLAGLIKAWFRELPAGVLDSLSPEQVMQCHSEEACAELVRHLPPTETALLDWAINLMADVVQHEHVNKMNARNIAMVFAPNMTQMADPLTALMYAVQVMNFLKTLILRTLREREDSVVEPTPTSRLEPFDENGHQSPSQSCVEDTKEDNEKIERAFIAQEPVVENSSSSSQNNDLEEQGSATTVSKVIGFGDQLCESDVSANTFTNEMDSRGVNNMTGGVGPSSKKGPSRTNKLPAALQLTPPTEKARGISSLSRIDSRIERIEAWR